MKIMCEPSKGVATHSRAIEIKASCYIETPENVDIKLRCQLGSGEFKFISFRIRCAVGVFGCDPSTLELKDDRGITVPSILVDMQTVLMRMDSIESEGIFRLAGEAMDVKRLKEVCNEKKLIETNISDVNAIATLLKIWYRELPTHVLNMIPIEVLRNADRESSIAAFRQLEGMDRNILLWLIRLLCYFGKNSAVNKMTLQNLAIVVAPNLYDASSINPIESILLLQKSVDFLHHLLVEFSQSALAPELTDSLMRAPDGEAEAAPTDESNGKNEVTTAEGAANATVANNEHFEEDDEEQYNEPTQDD